MVKGCKNTRASLSSGRTQQTRENIDTLWFAVEVITKEGDTVFSLIDLRAGRAVGYSILSPGLGHSKPIVLQSEWEVDQFIDISLLVRDRTREGSQDLRAQVTRSIKALCSVSFVTVGIRGCLH